MPPELSVVNFLRYQYFIIFIILLFIPTNGGAVLHSKLVSGSIPGRACMPSHIFSFIQYFVCIYVCKFLYNHSTYLCVISITHIYFIRESFKKEPHTKIFNRANATRTLGQFFAISVIYHIYYITIYPHQWHSGNTQNWKTGGARFKPRSRLST